MTKATAQGIRLVAGVVVLLISLYILLGPPSPVPLFEFASVRFGPAGIEGISEQAAMRLFIGLALLAASIWLLLGRIQSEV